MYDYLRGPITDKKKTSKGLFLTIEVSNIGYLSEVTEREFVTFNVSEDPINL